MKKLFTNDGFFRMVAILAVVLTVTYSVLYLISTPDMILYIISDLMGALCVAVLYISYNNHSKNVMKGMMGALLMTLFMWNLFMVEVNYETFDQILTIALLVIVTLLLVNHFIVNSNRKASPIPIRMNQVLCLLFALILFIDAIYCISIDENIIERIANGFNAIARICTAASIVCVESRLDAYRLDREAAGWIEEVGYPEGYVHEYQKRK